MLLIDKDKIRNTTTEIGIALVPLSMSLGMMAKLLIGNMLIGNVAMLLGVIMMFPFRRLLSGFHFGRMAGCMLFILLSYVYYFASKFSEPVYLLYLGVVLAYCLGLSLLRPKEDVSMEKAVFWIWAVSLFCVLCGYICFITGKINILEGAFAYSDSGDTIYDGLTMGNLGIVQMVSSFFMLSVAQKRKIYKVALLVVVLLDLTIVFLAFKRTPIVIALLVMLFYFRKLGYLKLTPKKIIALVIVIAGIIGYIAYSPDVQEAISFMYQDTVEGITNLVTGTHTGHSLTNSTDMRLENRQQAFDLIRHFDMLQYVIGAGFMTFWFDMPLVQSYLDMGIMGFLLYGYYTLLTFMIVFKKRKNQNDLLLCFAMFTIYGALSCVTSGHPYDHGHWEWICLLAYAVNYCNSLKKQETTQPDNASA